MGAALLDEVARATGLPDELITDELRLLLHNAGVSPSEVTLDDLREILADYLQEVLIAVANESSPAPK
jgi:hypothetical protein